MKKKITIIGIIFVLILSIIFAMISFAGNETLYVGINTSHSNGIGYAIGDASAGQRGSKIWNLRNYNSNNRNDGESSETKEIYCLKADYGESWTDSSVIVGYNLSYDLQSERTNALNLLNAAPSNDNTVVTTILDADNGYYKELLWVLDNMFVPGQSSVTDLLEKIGIKYDDENLIYYYEPDAEYDYSSEINLFEYAMTLTETDIKAVQQAVIWYFMNAQLDNNTSYDIVNLDGWLNITLDDGANYTSLADYKKNTTGEGPQREVQAEILYRYLIDSAINNAKYYTNENSYIISQPIVVNLSGLETDKNGTYKIEMMKKENNYIAGPIKIDKNNDLDYNIKLKISNTQDKEITNYTITDINGISLGNDVNQLVGIADGFYIKSSEKQIDIELMIEYNTTQKTLWLSGDDNVTSISLNPEQPAVQVEIIPHKETLKLTAEAEDFDLALRKYITAVNGTNITETRVPNIDESSLQTGSTATYKHRKNPVLVETGDIVTYKITIYNEGQKSGYATKITDQLPAGLKYTGLTKINSNKNTYDVSYDESTNKITFSATTNMALNKYEEGSLDSETLEFTCEVIAKPDTANDKILTNVSWISGAYDSKAGVEIANIGDDRDSTPQTKPTVNKDSIENYKGHSANKIDLTDREYHYQGEQDDDDFEKLIIEPQTSITVTKTWSDNNNQDGIRPNSVDVILYSEIDSNKEEKETQTLNNSNGWTYIFENLPLKKDGKSIIYSVAEKTASTGYLSSTTGDAAQGFTITNTHTPEVIEILVKKVWEDNDNQDGIRPTEITIDLLADGTKVDEKTITLNEENSWESKFLDLPKYKNGNEIIYTVEENGIIEDGLYESEITGDVATGFIITNTHIPELTKISVNKVWDDNNNQDGKRATDVIVKLLADGTETGKTITLNEGNSWKDEFSDLEKYKAGEEIVYTVEESVIEGYTNEITGNAQNGYVITNTHIPEKTTVLVKKVWEDNNNQDGIRPESITLTLYANNKEVEGESITLEGTENEWTYTFINLPKYENGKEIQYTVVESGIPQGYTSSSEGDMVNGYVITNTHIPSTINISVEKIWEDNNNAQGTRPTEITVKLLTNGSETGKTITLNEGNTWKGEFIDLPEYESGEKIEYTVAEPEVPAGYTVHISGNMTDGFTIKNTQKIFDLSLRKNIVKIGTNVVNTRIPDINKTPLEGTTETTAEYKHRKEPIQVQYGDKVIYQITIYNEGEKSGYASKIIDQLPTGLKYSDSDTMNSNKNTYNVTYDEQNNKIIFDITGTPNDLAAYETGKLDSETLEFECEVIAEPDTTNRKILTNVAWISGAFDTEENTVAIDRDSQPETSPNVDEDNIEDYTGNSSNKSDLDDENYHYKGQQDDDDFEKLVIEPESVNISVNKVWDDNNDQDGKRPQSIIVKLLANGTDTGKTTTLNKENDWGYTFSQLAQKSNGTEIIYTVEESEIPEGYDVDVTGNMTQGYTITNTHIPETRSINVKKVWEDSNNQDGKRPQSITITLYENSQEVDGKSITLNGQGNEWTHTFDNLPKYKNGEEIQYTVVETGIPQGYTSNSVGDMTNGYIITNQYIPETRNISVQKVWEDNGNQDGLRPELITVTLLADGQSVEGNQNITLSGEQWTHVFENLPKYKNGQEIQYTVQENDVPEGYTSLTSGNMVNGYIITNTYIPGMTSVKVTKVWEDNNDQDGIRPDSVNVSLLANEQSVQTIELNESNNWTYIFTNLPEKENGEYITYTVQEITHVEGYTTTITNNNVTSQAGEIKLNSAPEYTITNTHETDEISITINKVWDDENNYAQIRPTSVEVNIKNGETVVDTVTLNEKNQWTYTFENLPAKANGENINYTIEEVEPEGYTADIIDNGNNSYTIVNTHVPEKIFDLALRKYITNINNNELSLLGLPTRVPNISEDTLKTGKTANYRHRKNPVQVEEGDIVTYQISIYNEGEKSGYASQIIDQLPTGLIYNPSNTIVSKDANGNDKNTYTVTYEATTNKVIFDIVNTQENPAKDLEPYITNNLDRETIEIKCKVVYRAVAGEKNVLTNVAWINKAYDTVENKEIEEIGDDRDSEPGTKPNVNKDNMEDYKGNESNKNDLADDSYHYEGQQDEDDFEKLYVKTFDLSLRKFVTSVNGNKTSREPVVDVTPIVNKTGTTAIYKHSKIPVSLKVGDTVIYTIRVYNEGEIAGYANEVKDYLPPYLEYVENSTINSKYGWSISEDGRIATTTYLSNKEISEFNGKELDYEDLQIECKISNNAIPDENITNIAEISEYKYGETVVPEDLDSESDNIEEKLPSDENLPNYKEEQENDEYVPGNEDDDDFEKVYVKEFDLSLRKFITQVQDREITTRVPEVVNENGKLSYNHTKNPITLHVDDVVIYTLRIYNEGEIAGYASEITDDIPEYLEYLPTNETNIEYMWEMYDENGNVTENVEEAVKVKTKYLSKENGEDNLIPAFDGSILSYKDIKIAFKIKDPNSNTQIITNYAQISDDTDEDGNDINDKDSITDEWHEGEDDQDIENVKVEYFDLSILKFVSKVIIIEDGTEKITQTGYNGHENPEPVVKVELHKKKLDKVTVKFGYGITITNEGDVPGYATEITDYVPEGLRFEASDNPLWTDEGNNVISTKQLENTLLQPGESVTTEVILTWINGSENLALKTNIVEISDDNNQYEVPDRDSTPDNKVDEEDDIDLAEVILVISTGNSKTYFILTLGLLGVVLVGIVLIKKFVI